MTDASNNDNIDELLGEGYEVQGAIEGDDNEIDDALNDDVSMDESDGPIRGQTMVVDLTLEDTDDDDDDDDENEHTTKCLRRSPRRSGRGSPNSIFRSTANAPSAAAADISHTVTNSSQSDDTNSVESRFSVAENPAKKTSKRGLPTRAAAPKKTKKKKTNHKKKKKQSITEKATKSASSATSVPGVFLSSKKYKPLHITKKVNQQFYLMALSDYNERRRIDVIEQPPSKDEDGSDIIESKRIENGEEYELFCSKFEKVDVKPTKKFQKKAENGECICIHDCH